MDNLEAARAVPGTGARGGHRGGWGRGEMSSPRIQPSSGASSVGAVIVGLGMSTGVVDNQDRRSGQGCFRPVIMTL
ncbi:hypothetical protein JOD54_002907 [Actinokineospora baliensis]|nr:hypothetical protein [Actinokineospora baliensis]